MPQEIYLKWNGQQHIIGDGRRPLVVAEAGVNHNKDVTLAKELIDIAHAARADVVKFQTFHPEDVCTPAGGFAREGGTNFLEVLKTIDLPDEAFVELAEYSKEKGIVFLSTPYDYESADLLESINVPAFKICTTDNTNTPFIEYVARKGKPMFISTGMISFEGAKEAVAASLKAGNDQIVLMQCTAHYPASLEAANMLVLETYRRELGGLVGYSDHTRGELSAILAVGLGAVIIEKQFSKSRKLPGVDQKASVEPKELKRYIQAVLKAYIALGDGIKRITPDEEKEEPVIHRSLTSTRPINAGEIITAEDIKIRRPATGILPKHLDDVIGKTAATDISGDVPINETDVKW